MGRDVCELGGDHDEKPMCPYFENKECGFLKVYSEIFGSDFELTVEPGEIKRTDDPRYKRNVCITWGYKMCPAYSDRKFREHAKETREELIKEIDSKTSYMKQEYYFKEGYWAENKDKEEKKKE